MAGLDRTELKLPLIPIPKTKRNSNGNPKAIVSRRYYYIQFIDPEHNVRNSIYVEKQRYKDGTIAYISKSWVVKKKLRAESPASLLDKLGIKYEKESIKLVKA